MLSVWLQQGDEPDRVLLPLCPPQRPHSWPRWQQGVEGEGDMVGPACHRLGKVRFQGGHAV